MTGIATPEIPSYASGAWDVPLLGDTIGDNFDRTVARHGDRDALVDRPTGRRWTYTELAAEVDALALGLLHAGIGKGDRVGIWAPNCADGGWCPTQEQSEARDLAEQLVGTTDSLVAFRKTAPSSFVPSLLDYI